MLDKDQSYELIDFILDEAGDYQARVMITSRAEGLTRYANSEIHQNVFEDATSITITVTEEKKRSRVSTTVYDRDSLKEAVADAVQNLQFIPPGEKQPPAVDEPEEISADHYNPQLADKFGVDRRAEMLAECFDTLQQQQKASGKLTYQESNLAFGNSEGIKRFARGNQVNFSALVEVLGEGGGTGYAADTSTRPEDVNVLQTFGRAQKKAEMNRDREELEPGAYTVILEPLAVSNLLTYMAFTGFSAKSVQNQMSFLTGKQGEQVFDSRVNLVDDHTNENTVSLPFDFEGYPRQVVTLVEDGVVKNFIYDAMSAHKDGVQSTGHSVDMPQRGGMPLHMIMAGGQHSTGEIIANTDEGLLVTRFHYMNAINPRQSVLTGLTRDGVFKIEDGEITGAVKNMRFTESMLEAFCNVEAISSERERTPGFFGNYYVPALKIADFHFTGKTDA